MTAGSVELRITTEGECTCGKVYGPDNEPPPHDHHIECVWDRVEYPDPRPDRGEVGHLIIATRGSFGEDYYARGIDADSRTLWQHYGGVYEHEGRLFLTTAYPVLSARSVREPHGWEFTAETAHWTWELFPAHWADGVDSRGLFIGRWPD